MDLIQSRQNNNSDILEKRFIGLILKEESQELNQSQIKLMNSRGFTNPAFFNDRGFQVLEDHKLQYTHPTVLRFIDMKSRSSKNGAKRKKISYNVHNKPLYGMVNNVLRRLQFEFTDKMKQMLAKNYNIEV
jgi:hypothetical protein